MGRVVTTGRGVSNSPDKYSLSREKLSILHVDTAEHKNAEGILANTKETHPRDCTSRVQERANFTGRPFFEATTGELLHRHCDCDRCFALTRHNQGNIGVAWRVCCLCTACIIF